MKRIPGLSPQQNLIVGAAVRAVADETMEDALRAPLLFAPAAGLIASGSCLPSSTGSRITS